MSSDGRPGRPRVGTPRRAAVRERGHVLTNAAMAVTVPFGTLRYG